MSQVIPSLKAIYSVYTVVPYYECFMVRTIKYTSKKILKFVTHNMKVDV